MTKEFNCRLQASGDLNTSSLHAELHQYLQRLQSSFSRFCSWQMVGKMIVFNTIMGVFEKLNIGYLLFLNHHHHHDNFRESSWEAHPLQSLCFLIFTWALQKYIHPGNCWDCFASCGSPKNFAFPTLLWRVMEVEIQWNVADQGNPDIYCSWTIPVQQMSFGVQHSLCEVHLFLILRIPKSWGTPKSCISIGLSIIHKAIGVPPI